MLEIANFDAPVGLLNAIAFIKFVYLTHKTLHEVELIRYINRDHATSSTKQIIQSAFLWRRLRDPNYCAL